MTAGREKEIGGEGGSVLTASSIAQLISGELRGDGNARVATVAALDRAEPDQLSFCASTKYAPQLAASRASVVLVAPEVAELPSNAVARIVVAKPMDALIGLLPRLYVMPAREPGVHPSVVIGRGATIGQGVQIGPWVHIGRGASIGDNATIDAHCVIGDGVRVGSDSHLYPRVCLYSGAQVGRRVLIHAGATIGSDGFGYSFGNGRHEKIPHVGRCIIEDDVEIGAGTTIDRGSIDDTVIGAGTKIDNLVHLAHNVRVGRLCLILAQVGVAGSVHIEDGCILGGQVGVAGHHTIGKGARLGAQAGVFGDIPAGETWSGYPARPHRESLRAHATLFKLSTMLKRIEALIERTTGRDP